MNATQVFLRFIKEECRNSDGTLNIRKTVAWRKELRQNRLSTIVVCRSPFRRRRISKNFVDDYLSRHGRTLGGFMGNFIRNRSTLYGYLYGWNEQDTRNHLRTKWRTFLSQHIEGEVNKYWIKGRTFEYTWKN
jgi:hypothetical protein